MLLELYMSLITTSNLEHRVGDKCAYREADHMSRTRDKYPSHSNVQGQSEYLVWRKLQPCRDRRPRDLCLE